MNFRCRSNKAFSFQNTVHGGLANKDSSSLTLLAKVMEMRKATFTDRWDMELIASGSKSGLVRAEELKYDPNEELVSEQAEKFWSGPLRPGCYLVGKGRVITNWVGDVPIPWGGPITS